MFRTRRLFLNGSEIEFVRFLFNEFVGDNFSLEKSPQ